MSSSSLAGIRPPPTGLDEQLYRIDGVPTQAQNSSMTLTDALVMTLPATTAQMIVAGAPTTVTVSGISLTPRAILYTDNSTAPNLAMVRAATTQTAAPTFNFFRAGGSLGAESAVKNTWSLGIFSGSGYDGTDYAAGAQIDIQVDEADSGTADVASNSMGSMIRFLTSRRGTQNPTLSSRIRHNGGFQFNTAMTLVTSGATGMAGIIEADTRVHYYTPEDGKRGVCVAEYFTRTTSAYILSSTTGSQPMFPAGQQTLSLSTGTYLYECVAALASMSATSGNAAFHLVGAGNASVTSPLNVIDGIDAASNTASANSGSYNTTISTPVSMIVGSAGQEMGFRIHGSFQVEAAGTLTPSLALVTAAAAQVAAGSYFRCHPVGTTNATFSGPWS